MNAKVTTNRQTTLAPIVKVVLCGSFRREPQLLTAEYSELVQLNCEILSPRNTDFVQVKQGFAYGRGEETDSPRSIELRHLSAIQNADFLWLHCPEGYVGRSGALELGFAHAVGVPVFARLPPTDVTLKEFVETVSSPGVAIDELQKRSPRLTGTPLGTLQRYYARVATERGYERESARDCLLLLTEEMGELARAIRKREGLTRDATDPEANIAAELADVQLYLVHLANVLELNLGDAVVDKEVENSRRFLNRRHQQVAGAMKDPPKLRDKAHSDSLAG